MDHENYRDHFDRLGRKTREGVMMYCGQCGAENPDANKFCANCGAPVGVSNRMTDSEQAVEDYLRNNTEIEQIDHINLERDSIGDRRTSRRRLKAKKRRSIPWMIVAIVSLILGIVAWIIPSDVATWFIMTIALAAGIVSLCMRAKFRAISIISIVISGLLVFLWLIQGIMYLQDPHDAKDVSYGKVNFTIPAQYLAKVEETYNGDAYVTRDGNAVILVAKGVRGFSEDQFNNWSGMIENAIAEALATEMTITGTRAPQFRDLYDGTQCLTMKYAGTMQNEDVTCNVVFVNDTSSDNSVLIAVIYVNTAENKYKGDFDKIFDSIWIGTRYGFSEMDSSLSKDSSPESSILSSSSVDPQLKAALDEYEAFVDEYVDFMKKYQADPSNAIGMLSDYTSMLTRLADFSEKINGYDTGSMSKADYAYYLDVLSRVEKKMLDVAY